VDRERISVLTVFGENLGPTIGKRSRVVTLAAVLINMPLRISVQIIVFIFSPDSPQQFNAASIVV